MEKENLNWRSFAARGAIASKWNSPATPTYYLIDAEGIIRQKWNGNPGKDAIETAVDSLIEEVK